MSTNIETMPVAELLSTYRRILRELRRRGTIRTNNAPAGDFAELLVQQYLGGQLAETPSEKGWDISANGKQYQVKARLVDDPRNNGQRLLSVFRSWGFDLGVIVLFDDDFKVWKASIVPVETMRQRTYPSKQLGGDLLYAKDDLMKLGEDITEALQKIALGLT